MADTPFPLPREVRRSDILSGDGTSSVYGPFSFKIFDFEDVTVYTRAQGDDYFSPAGVVVAKVENLPQDHFTVEFPAPLALTTEFYVEGLRRHERTSGITRGYQLDPAALEKELSKQGVALQELRRDATQVDPTVADGDTLMMVAGRLVKGANALDIANAQENAAAAAASAVAAGIAREAAEDAAAAAQLRDPIAFNVAGNGTAGPYNIGQSIEGDSALIVHVSGVAQIVGTDFTYAGSNITFLTLVPLLADRIHGVVFKTRAIGVPDAGSISISRLATDVKEAIPSLSANADLVDNSADQLKAVYHKARERRHVKAFGATLSSVGAGSTAVDQAALAAAIASGEMISIDGAILQIEDPIVVNYPSANISAHNSSRVGDTATSKIKVMDDTLPYLFDCQSTNFECSGFAITGEATNVTTVAFRYKRPDGSASDIDSVLKNIVIERLAKPFHVFGRGLEVSDFTFAEMKVSSGDIDWPSVWTPNGLSNDLQQTGMRAYRIYDGRLHGCAGGIRNIGANAKNCGGLHLMNIQADIGIANGIFEGVAVEGLFMGISSRLNAVNAGLLFNIYPGSRKSDFFGFKGGGYYDGDPTHTRLSRNLININPVTDGASMYGNAVNEISELHFIGGSLGPSNRNAVQIFGSGKAKNISFQSVSWERCGIEGAGLYTPISVFESGGSLTEVTLKLGSCNFDTAGTTAPHILGGLNSNIITLLKDNLTTKPSAVPWAQSNVVLA